MPMKFCCYYHQELFELDYRGDAATGAYHFVDDELVQEPSSNLFTEAVLGVERLDVSLSPFSRVLETLSVFFIVEALPSCCTGVLVISVNLSSSYNGFFGLQSFYVGICVIGVVTALIFCCTCVYAPLLLISSSIVMH